MVVVFIVVTWLVVVRWRPLSTDLRSATGYKWIPDPRFRVFRRKLTIWSAFAVEMLICPASEAFHRVAAGRGRANARKSRRRRLGATRSVRGAADRR